MNVEPKQPAETAVTRANKRNLLNIVLICLSTGLVFCLLVTTGAMAAQKTSDNKIFKHISIASVPVGGLDKLAATEAVQKQFDLMIAKGLIAELDGKNQTVDLAPSGATDPDLVYPLLDIDVIGLVDQAYSEGRDNGSILSFFAPLWYLSFGEKNIPVEVSLAETKMAEAIRGAYPGVESAGTPTDFVITKNNDSWDVAVSPAVAGSVLNFSAAFEALKKDAADLQLSTLNLNLVERSSLISVEQAETLTPKVVEALDNAPYNLTFTTEDKERLTFEVTVDNLTDWLEPTMQEDSPTLGLNSTGMVDLLAKIHDKIDIAAHDAVFVTDGDRVTSFEPSREGKRVDDDALIASLLAAFTSGIKDIAISAAASEPAITTASSNDYGIKELLGTGTSNYGNSPSNRIANIKHGAEKLNGILIAPGETISLIENLGPFTAADGYLPELVIKGDEIKPEIGGGLCQIGTTTFRAAMNSGLDIVERRNHSLVVSYYNDPSNGNPGTDATIYDPAPDLKLLNDTPSYILLITKVDTKTHDLAFSFWGESDGRVGSYTPPKVLSWTKAGATQTKETDTLAAGVKKCQASHPGATTTFTYNIELPDGTTKSRIFDSTYRSLPQICLVGKTDPAPVVETPTADTSVDTPVTEPIPVE